MKDAVFAVKGELSAQDHAAAALRVQLRKNFIPMLVLIAWLLFFGFYFTAVDRRLYIGIPSFILAIVYPVWALYLSPRLKAYRWSEAYVKKYGHNAINEVYFTEECIFIRNGRTHENTRVDYSAISDVIETKTMFLPVDRSTRKYFIIRRDAFRTGDSAAFKAFIEGKCRLKTSRFCLMR